MMNEMNRLPMMTMQDAKELVESHKISCQIAPSDRAFFDAAMVHTLGDALQCGKATPELVAYVIKNICHGDHHEETNPFLANSILNVLFGEDEDED